MRTLAISCGLILFVVSLTCSLIYNYVFSCRFIPSHLWSNISTGSSSTTVVSVGQQLVGANDRTGSDNATTVSVDRQPVGTNDRSANATTTVSSTNTTTYCHLSDLNIPGPVHLWSMIAASSTYMIGHFIRHYKDVGVPVDNMSFLIQFSRKNELEDASTVLEENGINIDKISTTETYHSDIKRDAINKHIKSLPSDAWLVYPDLDEFFYFPCIVPMPFKAVCGHMVDRFASTEPDVPIPAIDSSTDNALSKQYQKCVKVRGRKGFITIADDRKMLLLPVSVEYPRMGRFQAQFKNSHKIQYKFLQRTKDSIHSRQKDFEVKCEVDRGAIDHYAWSSEQIDLTYKKFVLYAKSSQEKDGEDRKSDEDRSRVYRRTLVTMNRNTTAATWSLKRDWAETISQHEVACPEIPMRGEGVPIGREALWERTGMEPVHIVYAANEDSIAGVEASIRSIQVHTSGPIKFYFVGDIPLPAMPKVHWFNLTEIVQKYNIEDYMNLNNTRKNRRRDSINVYPSDYVRFALDRLITKQRKAMYINADIIVLCDVYSLINGVLNESNDDIAIAAVPRTIVSKKETMNHVIERLTPRGVEEAGPLKKSFDVGIFIVDLEKWRDLELSEKMRQIALKNTSRRKKLYRMGSGSQTLMNIVIGDRFQDIPATWDRDPENYGNKAKHKLKKADKVGKRRGRNWRTKEYEDICVLHYKGTEKPWQGVGPMPQEWLPYGHVVQ